MRLVAPFFQKPGSRLHLLNRATSGTNAMGRTAFSPERRNVMQPPGQKPVLGPARTDSGDQTQQMAA